MLPRFQIPHFSAITEPSDQTVPRLFPEFIDFIPAPAGHRFLSQDTED